MLRGVAGPIIFGRYARANPAARGRRHVQVTSSADGVAWTPFEAVEIAGYGGGGDIYFFAVQVNPAHDGSLTAVFPVADRLRGCLAMASSLDGVHWSAATPLLACDVYGERTIDQPASPAMLRRGDQIWLYVHEDVPRITIDRALPMRMYFHHVDNEAGATLARYSFPCELLAEWTGAQLATLAQGGARAEPFLSACGASSTFFGSAAASAPEKPAPEPRAADCAWAGRGPPFPRAHAQRNAAWPPKAKKPPKKPRAAA